MLRTPAERLRWLLPRHLARRWRGREPEGGVGGGSDLRDDGTAVVPQEHVVVLGQELPPAADLW